MGIILCLNTTFSNSFRVLATADGWNSESEGTGSKVREEQEVKFTTGG
jgi:hypothetical protein